MTLYPGIPDPSAFKAWIEKFKKTQAWICPVKSDKSDAVKHPIIETLKGIHSITVQRGSTEILEQNLLYACYMASKAPLPDLDGFAGIRKEFATELGERTAAIDAASALLGYIEAHRLTALRAIAQLEAPPGKFILGHTNLSAQRLESLEKALADLEQGLMDFRADKNHPAQISSAEFCYVSARV